MKIADYAGRCARLRGVCASRHGERPDLPWHSSLTAAGRAPVLAADHWRGELARLATDCDPADAIALRGHMATQRPTFLTPNP